MFVYFQNLMSVQWLRKLSFSVVVAASDVVVAKKNIIEIYPLVRKKNVAVLVAENENIFVLLLYTFGLSCCVVVLH